MNFEKPIPSGESPKAEFDFEREEEEILALYNERLKKLMEFRTEVFGKGGEDTGYDNCMKAYSEGFEKIGLGQRKSDEVKLTPKERAALLYQMKYNEIHFDMESAIRDLEERMKESQAEELKQSGENTEEPANNGELGVEDLEKRIKEI